MRRSWLAVFAVVLALLPGGPAVADRAAEPDPAPTAPLEVVGGSMAEQGRFPWMVRLSTGCGGSLIGSRYVLTAAHCVPRFRAIRSIVVTAGTVDLASGRAIRVRPTNVWRASGFRSATRGDDWAVLRLERALGLPTVRLARTSADNRGSLTVLGWGSLREGGGLQRRLRAARVSVVPDDRCAAAYASAGYRFLPDKMLCAGSFRRGRVDSCQGDSGGPLVRRTGRGWMQVGIVSWGHGCGRPFFPGVYTQISAYDDAITDVMRG